MKVIGMPQSYPARKLDLARSEAESHRRRVLAEIPLSGEELAFFQENGWGFTGECPEMPAAEEYEDRERWDVLLYLRSGAPQDYAAASDGPPGCRGEPVASASVYSAPCLRPVVMLSAGAKSAYRVAAPEIRRSWRRDRAEPPPRIKA
jgi:hypothetical protein